MPETILFEISDEDALWELLRRLLAGNADASRHRQLRVRGWKPELLYFPEEKIGHSIKPSVARAVADFHVSLSRSYALLAYGVSNASHLKAEDKESLDLALLVEDGSTGIKAIDDAIDRIVSGLINKMTGKQIVLSVAIFLALYFSNSVAQQWITENYNAKATGDASRERIALSEQETERLKILESALSAANKLGELKKESDESKTALVKPLTQYGIGKMLGADLTGDQAKIIASPEKTPGEGKRLDGRYRVTKIFTESAGGFIVALENIDSGAEFTAEANYNELTDEDIHAIFETAESKTILHAFVNAWFTGEKVIKAHIMRANKE